jgi:hypothetical protein
MTTERETFKDLENSMNFCDSAMEIITEKMMHRTET